MAALSFVIAGVFAVLHIKAACFVFLGMFLAFIAIIICVTFAGIYAALDEAVVNILERVCGIITTPASREGEENWRSLLRYFIGYTVLFVVMAVLIFLPYILQNIT